MADKPKGHQEKAGGDWGWNIVAALLGGFITIIAATIQVCLTIPPDAAQKNLNSWLVAGQVRSPHLPQITQNESILFIGTAIVIIGMMISILLLLFSVRLRRKTIPETIFYQVRAKIDESQKATGGDQAAPAKALTDAIKSNLGPIVSVED